MAEPFEADIPRGVGYIAQWPSYMDANLPTRWGPGGSHKPWADDPTPHLNDPMVRFCLVTVAASDTKRIASTPEADVPEESRILVQMESALAQASVLSLFRTIDTSTPERKRMAARVLSHAVNRGLPAVTAQEISRRSNLAMDYERMER